MSGHRPIAPSLGRDSQSSSMGKASGETDQSSAAQDTASTSPGSVGTGGAAGGENQRRRRAPGNVSAMACTECRHARQKVGY